MAAHCSVLRRIALLAAALAAAPAAALDLTLVGTFGDKAAILVLDNGEPRTVRVGQRIGTATLVSVERDRATVEIDGKRRVLVRGQTWSTSAGTTGRQTAVLAAGPGGHFIVEGQVNGGTVRFLVDTGASAVALPAADAQRLGIDYRKGQRGITQTASGTAPAYLVRLDSVRVGGIELHQVDGIVIEQGLSVALLGMTFLNRVEMKREGQTLTLTRRF
jgi:aspartyl protease family protein